MNQVIGAGGGCFPASTWVMTPTGEKRIDDLVVGDEVLSFDDKGVIAVSKVDVVHTHPADTILLVRYWGGTLRITANHWVLNQYNAFAMIGTMTEHDAIVDSVGHLRPVLSIEIEPEEPVFNLTVTPNHTFIADNIRVHNGGRGHTRPVIGSGGGSGKGGGGGRTAVEDPDSLRSHQYAKIIDLISEGEIGGLVNGLHSVFLNDTPVLADNGAPNFNGITLDYRNGRNDQSVIPGFTDVENEISVGVQVTKERPIVRTVTGEVDAVRVTVAIPQLTFQDTTTGDLHGTSLDFNIEVQNNGSGFRPIQTGFKWEAGGSISGNEVTVGDAYGAALTFTIATPKAVISNPDWTGGEGGLGDDGDIDGTEGSGNSGGDNGAEGGDSE